MKRSTARQFYQQYFSATQGASWLARLSPEQRLKMLADLMQWDVTKPTSDN
ncbi:glucose uptake inhibitor SgrT [Enterobacteriaceae bacterium 155047]|uniref:glucose uptake inhibitor SgrT n=1 Tax=Huaxiibacter chinensis TaxID=2899785 RepID=UPI0007DA767B|nr:glucose uptake inhibitor SgrT [Huaxiibacter chinensis]ANG91518.1 glucose uptake inhibitor SgrT [Lelliottia amnigena]MCG5043997.1 glucose uptake inhibitor SgrT [Huaxiibacter chinensis]